MGFFVQLTVVFVVICFSPSSCQDSLCARKLSDGNGIIFSFIVPTNVNEIPDEYRDSADGEKDCIIFMDLNWDEDVEIQFSPFRIFGTVHPPTVRIVSKADNFEASQNLENRTISEIIETKISGNTFRSVAIVYSRMSLLNSPFILRLQTSKARRFICPDLESEFGSVACSNGRELGSECTFKCNGSGLYPSPDLFNTNTQSEILKTFQSSSDPRFFSVCSLAERRRPAWKPDALTPEISAFGIRWKDVLYHWKCVTRRILEDVCLVTQRQAPNLVPVFYPGVFEGQGFLYASNADCLYPRAYLLSIFREEKDGDVVTTTTAATTTTTTTTLPGTGGFRVPATAEQSISGFQIVDCSVYCKFVPSSNSYAPKCGNYATDDELINCLTCRYTGSGCVQNDVV